MGISGLDIVPPVDNLLIAVLQPSSEQTGTLVIVQSDLVRGTESYYTALHFYLQSNCIELRSIQRVEDESLMSHRGREFRYTLFYSCPGSFIEHQCPYGSQTALNDNAEVEQMAFIAQTLGHIHYHRGVE